VTDDESEGGDCDEVICAGWGEPGGEWTVLMNEWVSEWQRCSSVSKTSGQAIASRANKLRWCMKYQRYKH